MGKKDHQVNVKLTEGDALELQHLCSEMGLDLSGGQVMRMAFKFFSRAVKENGAAGLLYKLLDEI